MLHRDRRASLELSIRAIVIVILAMTLLGLGLGFTRSIFKDIGGISSDVTEQIRQQILNDLITNDKKVSFPKTQIIIDKGDSEILTVGVRNKKDAPLFYKMVFNPISGPDGTTYDAGEWFQYGRETIYELGAAESDVRNIRLRMPTRVNAGSYFLTFDVVDDSLVQPNNIYATKDFFIVVRG